ncbi:MAG: porin family protein [Alphaproteobacteria bacterium]|nr:porin family protein [Alphaproteobacteria bacterium]
MTKKIFFLFLTIFCTSIAINSYAECDGFYIAGRLGQAKIESENDKSGVDGYSNDNVINKSRLIASGAVGYRHEHWRAELEYIWRKKNDKTIAQGISDVSFKSKSYMFVVYYDFLPYTWFTPFVNAGIGYTKNKLSIRNNIYGVGYSAKNNDFTWSVGAGISAKITNRLNMDIGYRYYDMGDGLDTLNGKTEVDAHEIYMGARYVL